MQTWRRTHSEALGEPKLTVEHPLDKRLYKGESMKRNLIRLGLSLMAVLFTAIPAFAQAPEAGGGGNLGKGLGLLGAIIGMGIAAGLCGMGQGRVAAAACEGMARNPSAYNRVQLALILGLAFIETLVIFTLVVVLLNAPKP